MAVEVPNGSIVKMEATYFHVKMLSCDDCRKEMYLTELKQSIKDDVDLAFWHHVDFDNDGKKILEDIGKALPIASNLSQ
jgi:hypothetical protein